ncbi:hypothetical protein [Parvicella tangerina]|uniref:Uncharacterized protein n=1 Tax=Parvicella tangerina TaxID=2829795 RepID=A0A916NG78_9FLAO|nr:hypothetical protein [Parvicella tangerina]CAG5080074.1 hypothetical protein CRYO30217_01172 [Parvicella tangerina]
MIILITIVLAGIQFVGRIILGIMAATYIALKAPIITYSVPLIIGGFSILNIFFLFKVSFNQDGSALTDSE